MILSDLAEVAVPRLPKDHWRMIEAACAACGFDEVTLFGETVVCAGCCSRICVLCGCTDELACDPAELDAVADEPCHWMLPGVCSTHEGDPRLARLAIPATAKSTVGMLN